MQWTREDVFMVAQRACYLSRQGRNREAAILLEGLVAVAPGDTYCRNALASVYMASGLPEPALDLCAGAPDVEARELRAEALLQLRRGQEADAELRWLAAYAPSSRLRRLALLAESNSPGGDNFQNRSPIT